MKLPAVAITLALIPMQLDAASIVQKALDEFVIYNLPVAFKSGNTTVLFPSAISGLYAKSVAVQEQANADFLISFTPGNFYFTVRALKPNAEDHLTVIHNRKAYVLHLIASEQPLYTVTFFQDRNSREGSRPVTPERLLSLMDKAKAYPLFEKNAPDALSGVLHASPNATNYYENFHVVTRDVWRFEQEVDMWLTGFDAPCCHTMYVDKPMHGHNLMQAIARVNRVFKDKPGGLVVDYIGIAAELKNALRTYTEAKGKGQPTVKAEDVLKILKEKLDVLRGMMHGFDYGDFEKKPLKLLAPAANHILGLDDGKKRFLDVMASVTKSYSLCGTLDDAGELRHEIAFFSAIRAALVKHGNVGKKLSEDEKNSALKQILDNAIRSEGVNNIFALAGLEKPNIGLLSDEFLEDVGKTPLKNLAVELLERLLKDEIRSNSRTNLVQEKKYSERLLATLAKYHNRAVETAQVIEELIALAKDFQAALKRNEDLGLNADEIAFYDALAEKPEVLQEMGDETLKKLAVELTEKLRASTTVDWHVRESVRASMRLMIKRLLRKYKYPPDGQEEATALVLKQAEALADSWTSDSKWPAHGGCMRVTEPGKLSRS